MTAYANLVSLMHLIEQIQLYHAHHPTFLDEHQNQLESLHEKVTNLQDLLEWCSHKGFDKTRGLEHRILNTAQGAEDIIELYIVGDIHGRSLTEVIMINPDNLTSVHKMDTIFFSEELQKVVECMDLIEKEMMKFIKEKSVFENQVRLPDHLQPTGSPESHLDGNNTTDMVGFEDEFNEIMSKLIGHGSNLKIISITGMGGIGKSTLAKSVCENRSTTNYFDVRGWIIVSQEVNAKRRMFDLLKEIGVVTGEYDEDKHDYHQLGEKLRKHLYGRRFLIIVDDIWSVADWEKFKLFLPDNSNGSRIILTTRLLNVAKDVGSSDIYIVNFLDEDKSWSLLCRKVFLNENCPPELLEVGKKIAKNCKGLPLSLSVIGGLLAKSEKTQEYWARISGDINMIVSSEDDERYLKILALSYSHLPIYLKPCFLYMGIFPEDHIFDVGSLIDLWIAEGFLKRRGASQSLEEVAQDYLEDLVARNLIYVSGIVNSRKTRNVRIHDLLRDLALREAQKEKFIGVATLHDPNFSMIINNERRVQLRDSKSFDNHLSEGENAVHTRFTNGGHLVGLRKSKFSNNLKSEFESAMNSSTSLRSLICDTSLSLPVFPGNKLLRVAEPVSFTYSPKDIFHLINSRHLRIYYYFPLELSSLQLLWNLQIIFIRRFYQLEESTATFPIWEMPLLRQLNMFGITLPAPPQGRMDGKGDLVLTNLQKISTISDFRCTDVVVRKISNIKELALEYYNEGEKEVSHYSLNNIGHLHKLQALQFRNLQNMGWQTQIDWFESIGFPQSLKKLVLRKCGFEWEHFTTKVGSLPLLEDLHLQDCYTGEEWILDEEEERAFLCLKVLKIIKCRALVWWSAESIHFPCLEHLFLEEMESLQEIPFEIGEIASLQSIHVDGCIKSTVASAKTILRDQRSFGNDGLRVFVNQKLVREDVEEVESGGGVVGQGEGEGEGEEEDEEKKEEEKEEEEKEEKKEEQGEEEEEEKEEQGEEDQEEEEEKEQGKQEQKKRSKGVVAFVVPFLVMLGLSYVLLRNKFGGIGKGRGEIEDKQKKNGDRKEREADDSWFSSFDYP